MALALLKEPPFSPPAGLGPYRRRDHAGLPDEPRCELILGRFYVSPSPSLLHQVVLAVLLESLRASARSVGALALPAPLDVHLADHSIVQPDILYLSAGRRHLAREWVEGAPDLLVEILSRGSVRRDRGEKLDLYARSGVLEYWIVDPVESQIEFLVLQGESYEVVVPRGVYRSRSLPEVSLDLEETWRAVAAELTGER